MAIGRKRSERVKLLIEHFHEDFMQGMAIHEIEEKYNISKGYAYNFLEEIAERNNVNVETYYQIDHGPHITFSREGRLIPNKNISIPNIKGQLTTALDALDKAEQKLDELTILIKDEINRSEQL